MEIIPRIKMQGESVFLIKHFVKMFEIMPHLVFTGDNGILLLIPKNVIHILFRKSFNKIEEFRMKYTKPIYFIGYSNNLEELLRNLYHHVKIKEIFCIMEDPEKEKYLNSNKIPYHKKNPISILIILEDNYMPMALGKKGAYMHLVNDFLKKCVGNITIYLRSE